MFIQSLYCRKTKDSTAKLTQLKRNQQTEKKNSAQMLEEARQRENQMTEDMTKLQVYNIAISQVDVLGIISWLECLSLCQTGLQVICRDVQYAASIFFLCYQMDMKEKSDRVEELEAALRESVTITAQREMLMAQQQQKLEHGEKQASSQL